jgi:hypothetical protein
MDRRFEPAIPEILCLITLDNHQRRKYTNNSNYERRENVANGEAPVSILCPCLNGAHSLFMGLDAFIAFMLYFSLSLSLSLSHR